MLDVLHNEAMLADMRRVMLEFFVPLKACEAMVKFCFITGITKFSQLCIFSTINNLKNVSLNPRFSAICGFTEKEVKDCEGWYPIRHPDAYCRQLGDSIMVLKYAKETVSIRPFLGTANSKGI